MMMAFDVTIIPSRSTTKQFTARGNSTGTVLWGFKYLAAKFQWGVTSWIACDSEPRTFLVQSGRWHLLQLLLCYLISESEKPSIDRLNTVYGIMNVSNIKLSEL